MFIKDQNIIKDLRAKTITVDQLAKYLLENYPASQLAHELAEDILDDSLAYTKKVVLTIDQFESMFKVQGYRVMNGVLQKEPRGKVKKED